MAAVADPLGGSYFVETLTDQMEAAAMAYIDKIDEMGGIVRAVEEGYPQREIAQLGLRVPARGRHAASAPSSASTSTSRATRATTSRRSRSSTRSSATQIERVKALAQQPRRARRRSAALDAVRAPPRQRRRAQRDAADPRRGEGAA